MVDYSLLTGVASCVCDAAHTVYQVCECLSAIRYKAIPKICLSTDVSQGLEHGQSEMKNAATSILQSTARLALESVISDCRMIHALLLPESFYHAITKATSMCCCKLSRHASLNTL